ncbi:MAG: Ig-like domain-containing protein, partial [Myxococcota bacterium]|nr:Ig-like domain-containing protein [Myxococcota bacterium]
DGDATPDDLDNCPDLPNPGQENEDGVGEGDACDVTPPEPPVITSPERWAVLTVAAFVVRGSAEVRSLVQVYDFDMKLGSTYADGAGNFELPISTALRDGFHAIIATATDAAGNRSSGSTPATIRVEVEGPLPPIITAPVGGEVVMSRTPVVEGQAEAEATVRIHDGGTVVGQGPAFDGGLFAVPVAVPLADGIHVLTATATDALGRTSLPSAAVAVRLLVPTPSSPVLGAGGKISLVGLADSPDPIDFSEGPSHLNVATQIDPVAGLAGGSPNHTFALDVTWTVNTPDGMHPVKTMTASKPLPSGPAVGGALVSASTNLVWDGTDNAGKGVGPGYVYPYRVDVRVVRIWTGTGRGPRCARHETSATSAGRAACVVDEIQAVPGTIRVDRRGSTSIARHSLAARNRLAADHAAAGRARFEGMTAAERQAEMALLGQVLQDPSALRVRLSRESTLRGAYGWRMAIPVVSAGVATPESAALAALSKYSGAFGLAQAEGNLIAAGVRRDPAGGYHFRFRQVFRGLPVFGSGVLVHLTADLRLAGFDGLVVPPALIDWQQPFIDQAAAVAAAVGTSDRGAGADLASATARLGIFSPEAAEVGGRGGVAAYVVHLPDAGGEAWRVYVGASDGQVLHGEPAAKQDLWREVWFKGWGRFDPPTTVDGALLRAENDPEPIWPSEGDPFKLWDIMKSVHGYYSFGPAGYDLTPDGSRFPPGSPRLAMIGVADSRDPLVADSTRAYWLSPVPGRSDERNGAARFGRYAVCQDVVFHEYTHAVQDARWAFFPDEARDAPDGFLAATIGESFADIVPEFRESGVTGHGTAWTHDVDSRWLPPCRRTTRNLRIPPDICDFAYRYGRYPDNWSGLYDRVALPRGRGLFPMHWVRPSEHFGATILGKAAYLMDAPSTAWEESGGVPVPGVGHNDAEAIWLDSFVNRIVSPDFRSVGEQLVAAAVDRAATHGRRGLPGATQMAVWGVGIWSTDREEDWAIQAGPSMVKAPVAGYPERRFLAYLENSSPPACSPLPPARLVVRRRDCPLVPPCPWPGCAASCNWTAPALVDVAHGAPAMIAHAGRVWLFFRSGDHPYYASIDPATGAVSDVMPARVEMPTAIRVDPGGCGGGVATVDEDPGAVVIPFEGVPTLYVFWRLKQGREDLGGRTFYPVVAVPAAPQPGDSSRLAFGCAGMVGETRSTFAVAGPLRERVWLVVVGKAQRTSAIPPGAHPPSFFYSSGPDPSGTWSDTRLLGVWPPDEPPDCPREPVPYPVGVRPGEEWIARHKVSAAVHRGRLHVAATLNEMECVGMECAGRRLVYLSCGGSCEGSRDWTYPVSLGDRADGDLTVYPVGRLVRDMVGETEVLHLFTRSTTRLPDYCPEPSMWTMYRWNPPSRRFKVGW